MCGHSFKGNDLRTQILSAKFLYHPPETWSSSACLKLWEKVRRAWRRQACFLQALVYIQNKTFYSFHWWVLSPKSHITAKEAGKCSLVRCPGERDNECWKTANTLCSTHQPPCSLPLLPPPFQVAHSPPPSPTTRPSFGSGEVDSVPVWRLTWLV